jgi:hypothetical protein
MFVRILLSLNKSRSSKSIFYGFLSFYEECNVTQKIFKYRLVMSEKIQENNDRGLTDHRNNFGAQSKQLTLRLQLGMQHLITGKSTGKEENYHLFPGQEKRTESLPV